MKVDPNMWTRVKVILRVLFILVLMSASSLAQTVSQRISSLYSKGLFDQIAATVPTEIRRLSNSGRIAEAAEISLFACRSYNQLGKLDEAIETVDSIAEDPKLKRLSPALSASLHFCKASIFRSKRDYKKAFEISSKGLALAPNDPATIDGYHLEIGRTLYSSGHDFAAIVWLEKAERESLSIGNLSLYFDALRFLSLAWSAKFYYANALSYAEKLVEHSSRGEVEHRNRIAFLELASLLDLTGQPQRAKAAYLKGLDLSTRSKVDYHTGQFLSALFHRELYDGHVDTAEKYLRQLESIDTKKEFVYECLLGNALVSYYRDDQIGSSRYFEKLKSEETTSEFVVPYWKTTIAERDQDWKELFDQAEILLKITEDSNFQDDLPNIYYKLALASWKLGSAKAAKTYAIQSLELFEPLRISPSSGLTLAMMETHHSVYRLLSGIEAPDDVKKAFEYSELLKANLLRDRIEGSTLKPQPDLSDDVRKKLSLISNGLIEGTKSDKDLSNLESVIIADRQIQSYKDQDLSADNLQLPSNTALVSYQFIPSGDLMAFVIESGKNLRLVNLSLTDREAETLATEVRSKIKDRIFFKSDGKKAFDLLLKPLNLRASHFVIVPDKHLWKIPFQALSPDGSKYLIETTTISYSPSVSFLKKTLSNKAPIRTSIKIFGNDTFNNLKLAHVNTEAVSIGRLFGTTPHLDAAKQDFMSTSPQADIYHFSMHAQLDSENPLSSFLAFKSGKSDPGRLTVTDLLSIRLKPNSLVFLASCDTSKVFNGEGLVSIPWAMLGSGSSTVVSSQWEAADNATKSLAVEFYSNLKSGHSTAESLQNTAVSLINNKDKGFHEPYFWATFNLMGDYR